MLLVYRMYIIGGHNHPLAYGHMTGLMPSPSCYIFIKINLFAEEEQSLHE